MAGLLAYAALGAAAEVGAGIVDRARALEAAAMEQRQEDKRQAERMEERQWQIEDRDFAAANRGRGGGGGGGRRSSGGGGISGSTGGAGPLAGEYEIGGILHGRTKSGEMVPYKDPQGNPVRLDGAEGEGPTDDLVSALRSSGIPTPSPEIMAQMEAEVAAGSSVFDVVGRLEVPEEVTNPAGTMASRALGLTPEDAPPDQTRPGKPTALKPKGGIAATTASPAAADLPQEAIDMLAADPTPEKRAQFDEIFGAGAAARALGG